MVFLKILLLFHILGDFYFQTNKLSNIKKDKIVFLIIHVLIYTFIFIPVFFMNTNVLKVLTTLIFVFVSHLACDYIISKISNKDKSLKLLLIDQTIHILIVIISWFILKDTTVNFTSINTFLDQHDILISVEKIIGIVLVLLILGRPTSIIIEKSLPTETKKEESETGSIEQTPRNNVNYGSLIGILERIIIVLLVVLGLWSSIALVFTAKSIARFKQLEDQKFAQKYLVGTLLSFGITLGALLLFL